MSPRESKYVIVFPEGEKNCNNRKGYGSLWDKGNGYVRMLHLSHPYRLHDVYCDRDTSKEDDSHEATVLRSGCVAWIRQLFFPLGISSVKTMLDCDSSLKTIAQHFWKIHSLRQPATSFSFIYLLAGKINKHILQNVQTVALNTFKMHNFLIEFDGAGGESDVYFF